MIKQYKKKSIVIEAMKWNGSNIDELFELCEGNCFFNKNRTNKLLFIKTLEGNHLASVGDYIIKGVQGEFYPCKPDIFEQTYEEVQE